ncbi:MAG TPA: guanylate kinase [Elusimicrobia bacterium]|nr:guanylate kinase [Elusimicrobiota bacterium]HBT60926.1 guanylate kinase [Elusimicrobiota bacterium]
MPKGALVIISAPSGTGKSTVCRKLLQRRRELRYSVSCTTRVPRPGEKHGRHYFFLSPEEFKRRIQRHEFLEWAMVHGNYYGTPRHFIEDGVQDGHWILLAIDVQGAAAIRRKLPDSVLIFLVPPSWEALKERLAFRRDDSESVATRLANARAELASARSYDYIVVNDELDAAVEQVESILTAESLKSSRQEPASLPLLPVKDARTRDS